MVIKLEDIRSMDIDIDLARLDLCKLGKEIARLDSSEIAQVLNGFSDDLSLLDVNNYDDKIRWIAENLNSDSTCLIDNLADVLNKEVNNDIQ